MPNKHKLHSAGFGLLALLTVPLLAHDGEWPPKADPQWDATLNTVINNPDPPGTPGGFNTHLYLDRIEFSIPSAYANWMTHWHEQSGCGDGGGRFADFAIGDVDNDGMQDDIVITQPGEAVLAAEMQINWSAKTGTLNPLWFWLSPYATTVMGSNPNSHSGVNGVGYTCEGTDRNNPLIWNVVDDGTTDATNEVVVVALDENKNERLFILRHAGVGVVTPVATSPADKIFQVDHRLGIARVRSTPFPRDIVMTEHGEGRVFVWSWENGNLVHKYTGDPFYTGGPLGNPGILAKVHECNWGDVDGDGFDEFCLNGVVDFVDADGAGNPIPTNTVVGKKHLGVARWQIMDSLQAGPGGGAHCDMVMMGDWDPTRYGLEIYAVTEAGSGGSWKDAQSGLLHTKAVDTLWDADCGTLIDEWDTAPADDGQSIFAGNWTSTYAGIESISSPKDPGGTLGGNSVVIPPGQEETDGSYVVATRVTPSTTDADFRLLTIDGPVYNGPGRYEFEGNDGAPDSVNNLKIRSGGPWRRMFGIDWDGDYKSDEILHHPFNEGNLILFRLGDKQELVVGSYPPGVPSQGQVQNHTPPILGEGFDPSCGDHLGWWYFFSQGECSEHIPPATGGDDWSFQNGGPGRGTHYFEKLKEVWPGNDDLAGAVVVHPYDLVGSTDHREEVIAITIQPSPTMSIYYNSDALPADAFPRPSPRDSLEYRRYRQTQVLHPFSFQEQAVAIRRFGVRPVNSALPARTVGIGFGGSVQLEAFIEFEDGSELDVSNDVTWVQDAESQPYLSLNPSGLVTEIGGIQLSGRFHAEMVVEGKLAQSLPSYVFTSNSSDPAVLRAGLSDSWIVNDSAQDDRLLRLEAYVAQKDNLPSVVYALNPSGSTWHPNASGMLTPPSSGSLDLTLADDGVGPDELAGDGVYSALVSGQGGLSLGDNLKAIRAMLPPITFPPPPAARKPLGVANSEPWPYYVHNTSSSSPWPNPASPPQLQAETSTYQGARVRSMGYRGWKVPNEMLLEVETIPSVLHPDSAIVAYANVPNLGYALMTDQGGNIHTLKLSTSAAPSGLYVSHVVTNLQTINGFTMLSDFYPKIRVHGYPSWDVDQPADFDPSCGELEPSRW